MMDLTDIPPMPDLHCPDWCERDHLADWQLDAAAGETDMWEPLHDAELGRVSLAGRETLEVRLSQSAVEGFPHLFLDGEGSATSVQARAFAALLLDAADRLEAVTRG